MSNLQCIQKLNLYPKTKTKLFFTGGACWEQCTVWGAEFSSCVVQNVSPNVAWQTQTHTDTPLKGSSRAESSKLSTESPERIWNHVSILCLSENILRHLTAMLSGTCLHQKHAEPPFYKCQGGIAVCSLYEKSSSNLVSVVLYQPAVHFQGSCVQ